jgi:hypothetical protein
MPTDFPYHGQDLFQVWSHKRLQMINSGMCSSYGLRKVIILASESRLICKIMSRDYCTWFGYGANF